MDGTMQLFLVGLKTFIGYFVRRRRPELDILIQLCQRKRAADLGQRYDVVEPGIGFAFEPYVPPEISSGLPLFASLRNATRMGYTI